MTEARLKIFVVEIDKACTPVTAIFVPTAVHLGFLFEFPLARHTQTREWQGFEAFGRDLFFAHLADAVTSSLDALQGVIDGMELVAISVAEDQTDFSRALLAGKIVGVHPFVDVAFLAFSELFI